MKSKINSKILSIVMNYLPVPEIKEINTYIVNWDINLLKQKSITMKYLLCIWKKVLIKEILINNNWLSFFLNMVK